MTSHLKKVLFFAFLFFPITASAYIPANVKDEINIIDDPVKPQVFYGTLQNTTSTFQIESEEDFNLYFTLLIPDSFGSDGNIFAKMYKYDDITSTTEEFAFLDGANHQWNKKFYKKFKNQSYLWGPEFASPSSTDKDTIGLDVTAGIYSIDVYSASSGTKDYILIVGDQEIPQDKLLPKTTEVFAQESGITGSPILRILSVENITYLLVPIGIIFLFLLAAVSITVKQVKDRMKTLDGHH